jgi:hypothetical protein
VSLEEILGAIGWQWVFIKQDSDPSDREVNYSQSVDNSGFFSKLGVIPASASK